MVSTIMYKAVICDLDGTLLNSNHTISEHTKEVIRKVHQKGIRIFIATGRHHKDALVFKKMLGLDSYMITSNGAAVHNADDAEVLRNDIPSDISTEILDMKIDPAIHKNLYCGDSWFVEEPSPLLEGFYKETDFTFDIVNFASLKGCSITKFFYMCEDEEKLQKLEESLIGRFDSRVSMMFSLPICLEVMMRGISKGYAINQVLKKLNIPLAETVAFGDGLNDFEMLKEVGKGCLMGNCDYKLRQSLPNHEIIDTNDNDGVAKYLTKLFL